jgi:hypothetical protein
VNEPTGSFTWRVITADEMPKESHHRSERGWLLQSSQRNPSVRRYPDLRGAGSPLVASDGRHHLSNRPIRLPQGARRVLGADEVRACRPRVDSHVAQPWTAQLTSTRQEKCGRRAAPAKKSGLKHVPKGRPLIRSRQKAIEIAGIVRRGRWRCGLVQLADSVGALPVHRRPVYLSAKRNDEGRPAPGWTPAGFRPAPVNQPV